MGNPVIQKSKFKAWDSLKALKDKDYLGMRARKKWKFCLSDGRLGSIPLTVYSMLPNKGVDLLQIKPFSSCKLFQILKTWLSPSKKLFSICFKPIKNDENFFLFPVKSSFLSWDIYIFVQTFWLCRKMTWHTTDWTTDKLNTHIAQYL